MEVIDHVLVVHNSDRVHLQNVRVVNEASRRCNQMTLSQIDTLDTKFRENFGLVVNCIRGVIKQ